MSLRSRACFVLLSAAAAVFCLAQDTEVNLHDEPATFRARVNLVLVPVVVRDKTGRALGDFKKEDFALFDNGKPQVISKFSIEKAGAARPEFAKPENAGAETPAVSLPDRFVIYLFDDVHLNFPNLVQVRDAAGKHIDSGLHPSDRVAIFTTSGQGNLDFTDDRAQVHEALLRLRPRPIGRASFTDCPYVSYYLADLIEDKHDNIALEAVIQQAGGCLGVDPNDTRTGGRQQATAAAQNAVAQSRSGGEQESRVAISVIRDAIRRVSAMPGQRLIVLASPGFFAPQMQFDRNEIVDRALRANVIINALDARGLYVVDPNGGDISTPAQGNPAMAGLMSSYYHSAALVDTDFLFEIASGTGGKLYENSNDLGHGFELLAAAPEYVYLLGFAPQNLKLDGRVHNLKVTLKDFKNLNVQARKAYYAPRTVADPKEMERQEIEEALFSREPLRDFPVQLRMQFFKRDDANAKLSATAHIDLKTIRFRKAEGRNLDNLTIVYGLFDRNGNFISGNRQTVEMRFLDQTFPKVLNTGLTLRSSFDVHPGGYMVRLVVRDAEGQTMAAENGGIEIP
jgi:VWFA-related protein